MDVAHRFGCQATGHLLGNDAGSVPPNRCSCGVDCRLTCVGNLTSRGVFTLGDPIRPVGVHLAVAVALDASFREQLPIKLQQLRFVEVLKALAADPGNDVRLGVILPVLPRCGIDRRFRGPTPDCDSCATLRYVLGACRRPHHPRRPPNPLTHRRHLALGHRDIRRMATTSGRLPLNNNAPATRPEDPTGRGKPAPERHRPTCHAHPAQSTQHAAQHALHPTRTGRAKN